MSNDELNKYKELHSEFTEKFVKYYNRNLDFINNVSHDGNTDLKKLLREMIEISTKMKSSILSVYKEMRENRKEELAAKKAKRKFHKPQHQPPGRPRKNTNDNNKSTPDSV
jgi:hypothetical protein